ncbi:RNA polymerase sigma-70 factor [Pedobacter sp. AW1-32]|uniref:RNA polymerase sigma-70 factor n=1 Tax=Pedobacter sp. AW1-32 TaxID=3383026 RepID=UPI003FF0D809
MKIVKPDLLYLWSKICLENDVQSFEALYRHLYTRLLKFSIQFTKNKEVSEDIIAEVFVRCWENRKNSAHLSNLESYFFVAVKNQTIKQVKKNSSFTFIDLVESLDQLPAFTHTPETLLEQKELHRQLNGAIETLPAQCKLVFRLIKESGLKYKEVAELLEISPRTVQTQLFRAIAKLRLILKPDHFVGNGDHLIEKLVSIVILLGMISFF